jgi:hypothetical protein
MRGSQNASLPRLLKASDQPNHVTSCNCFILQAAYLSRGREGDLPSGKCLPGDTVYVRAQLLQAGSDGFQILIDDGVRLSITTWVPARECAKLEDIGELKPPRSANPRHVDR